MDPEVERTSLRDCLNWLEPGELAETLAILDAIAAKDRDDPPDFATFLERYVYIADEGGTKFQPWRWQSELAETFQASRMLLILKARQLGISWLVAAYAVYRAIFEKGCLVLVLSYTEDEAKELLAKCQFVFDALPEPLKPKTGTPNTKAIRFPALRSSIVAMPSTKRAGRGRTAKLAICDEYAFFEFATENFAALKPTVEAGGQWIVLSSADGLGNQFAELWSKVTSEKECIKPELEGNGVHSFGNALKRVDFQRKTWVPIFLPYSLRPGRDQAWWDQELEGFAQAWMIHQEFPSDADEAFIQTGRVVFDPDVVRKHKTQCCDPLPQADWTFALRVADYTPPGQQEPWPVCPVELFAGGKEPNLRVWQPPVADHLYLAGVDVAEGLEQGDYNHLVVIDQITNEEVLTLHGHWPPDVLAALVDRVARLYPGLYGIERNNHGHACILMLKQLGTPGLYRERPVHGKAGEVLKPAKLGWATTITTKPLCIDELGRVLRSFELRLNDALNIPELLVYKTFENGTTGAPTGKYDDRVMALAIANQMRKYLAREPGVAGIRAQPLTGSHETATAANWRETSDTARRYSVMN